MLRTHHAIFSLVNWPSVVFTFVVVTDDFESSRYYIIWMICVTLLLRARVFDNKL